jgi:hypothetical protein
MGMVFAPQGTRKRYGAYAKEDGEQRKKSKAQRHENHENLVQVVAVVPPAPAAGLQSIQGLEWILVACALAIKGDYQLKRTFLNFDLGPQAQEFLFHACSINR